MSITSANMLKRKPKSKVVFVKVDATEHRTFADLATMRHTTLSELIRQLLHREVAQSKEQAA